MTALPTPLVADATVSIGLDVHRFNRTAGAWVEDVSTQVTAADLNQTITSAVANGDTAVGLSASVKGTTATAQFGISNTPSNFVNMNSLNCHFSSAIFGTYSDDGGFIDIRIMASGGGTVLAGAPLILARRSPLIATAYNQTFSFTTVNTTATKAQWDGAYAEIRFSDAQVMGPDGATLLLVDFRLTGDYTASAPQTYTETLDTTVTATTSIVAVIPFADDFTYSNDASLAVISGRWTTVSGGWQVISEAIAPAVTSVDSYDAYSTATADQNHFSQVLVSTPVASGWLGPTVRGSNSALTCYWARIGASGQVELVKVVNGLGSTVGSATVAAGGHTVRLEARTNGSSADLAVFIDGSSTATITYTDTTAVLTGTYLGVFGNVPNSGAVVDNWVGGLVTASTPSETLDTTVTATTNVTELTASAETHDHSITATTSLADAAVRTETLDTTVTASTAQATTDFAVRREARDNTVTATTSVILRTIQTVTTTVSGTTTLSDFAVRTESLDTAVIVTTEVTDVLDSGSETFIETLDTTVTSTSDLAEALTRVETLDTTIDATSSLLDDQWITFIDGVSAATGATVTGLTNEVDYEFRVAAINSVGQGPWSNIAGPYTPTSGAFQEPVETLVTAATTLTDIAVRLEAVNTAASVTTEVSASQALVETLDTTATVTSQLAETANWVHVVDTSIDAITELDEAGGNFENLSTLVNTSVEVVSFQNSVEAIDTVGSVTTSTVEAQNTVQALDVLITATTTLLDVPSGGEELETSVTATTQTANVAVRRNTVDTTGSVTTQVTERIVVPALVDTLVTATTSMADPQLHIEVLDTTVDVSATVLDETEGSLFLETSILAITELANIQTSFEVLSSSVTSTQEVTALARRVETLDTSIVSTTFVAEGQDSDETLDSLVSATTDITTQVGRVDFLNTLVTATTTLVDPQTHVVTADTTINFVSDLLVSGDQFEDLLSLGTITTELSGIATRRDPLDTLVTATVQLDNWVSAIDLLDTLITATTFLELDLGGLKVGIWNGTSWDLNSVRRHNGSGWVQVGLRVM